MKSWSSFYLFPLLIFCYILSATSFRKASWNNFLFSKQHQRKTLPWNSNQVIYHFNLHYKSNNKDDDEDREYFTSFENEEDEEEDLQPSAKKRDSRNNRPSFFIGKGAWKSFPKALFVGIFIAGIGTGVTLDSAINTNPKDLASRDAIDRNAPNPKLCSTYGSSAMVLDQRVFVTFNPFNVYVTQADTKPGCVLRPANVVPLLQQQRQLLTNDDVESCKNGYNTWAFVGDINSKPQLSCVFQSDDAQNEFLSNPKIGLGEDIYEKASTKTTSPPTNSP